MEIKQQLRLSQQLVMTPQLQQAIRLLQLSRLELVDEVRKELDNNPVLSDEEPAERIRNTPGEVRTVTANSLRFSLQFAQSFGPFTGRFGIKESTGGVGLDTLLLDNRFEIRQDLYGFGEVVLPRWRVSLAYQFINRIWLLGGVDDILSNSRRDYFVGAQLRFNDEDLKGVLPFMPKISN